ncbi:DNA-binding protein, partial [Rhodococcus aetherivorans]|nr:DNA-binding protein [Rhodococcus aetherivorans]
MTATDPAAPETGPESLARWLSDRRDADLAELLRARPDLVVPPPATMAVLAGRAQQRASVFRAADELTVLDFGVVDALTRLGADREPVTRRALLDSVSGRVTAKNVDRSLDRLRRLSLVWGPADGLRLVKAAAEAVPWRIGRSPDPEQLPAPAEVGALLADLDPAQRSLLDTLARTSPVGRTRDAAAGTPADRPVQRLLTAGLLIRLDDETVELPHRVGQALRGEAPFDPAALT